MEDKIVLSPSRIRTWVRCRRSYYWKYHQKLSRLQKGMPLELGSVVSEVLAGYYQEEKSARCQGLIDSHLEKILGNSSSEFLGEEPDKKRKDNWNKIVNISRKILSTYHDWAQSKDNFEVAHVELPQEVELTSSVHLLAIPDTVVLVDPDTRMILEHKVRYKYRPGDFGIDYQSVGSCLVSGSIGTLYNVLEYGKLKNHRNTIIRSGEELDYFRNMFIHIGEDILSTPPECLYPMPMGRCYCDYWELCNAEQTGLDVDDIISELYQHTASKLQEKEDTEGGKSEQT